MFLWPANGPRDKAPGAIRSVTAHFRQILGDPTIVTDKGALRRQADGSWEYLEMTGWKPWEPSRREHRFAASAFRRYGVGWSFGPAWNLHFEHLGYVLELCEVDLAPDSMAAQDLEHNVQLFLQLQHEWMEAFGQDEAAKTESGTEAGAGA
jgi:hypothetical protein